MKSAGRGLYPGKGAREISLGKSESDSSASATSGDAGVVDFSLEQLLKPMLPPGVPLLSYEQLDYSIAIEYMGPPIKHPLPKAEVVESPHSNQSKESGSSEQAPIATSNGFPSSPSKLQLRKPVSLDVQVRKGINSQVALADRCPLNMEILSPVTGLLQADIASPVIGLVKKELTSPLPRSSLSKVGSSSDVGLKSNSLLSKKQLEKDAHVQSRTEASNDCEVKFPDSPDSVRSSSSEVSEACMNSGMTSLSRKSSCSEIEEVNGQPSTSNPATASVLMSPSRLTIPKAASADWHQNRESTLSNSSDLFAANVGAFPSPGARSHSLPVMDEFISYSPGKSFSKDCDPMHGSFDEPDPNLVEQRKKGECYWCLKGHRLIEKEACLVCNSKYCRNCVLIAMGSMPEGRKCVRCTGQPINESKRSSLGKPSRLLKRLLSPLEVQQIMKAEKKCPANQLRPEQLVVNGRALTPEELADLLGCSNPPPKLKPGSYWYDKVSGLWGKEGEQPDSIITPQLKVGGELQQDASNGCTQVHMNGREISKTELKMLKLAGVQCPPKTYLQLFPDGTYVEEGQKNIKGNIWTKKSKILYPFFSLPTPSRSSRVSREYSSDFSSREIPEYLDQKKVHKLLLLGHEGSGRSTIFKQAKFLYQDGFSEEEMQKFKELIQRNLYKYLVILLEGRERFEEEEEEIEALTKASEGSASSSAINYSNTSLYVASTSSDKPSHGPFPQKNKYAMDTKLKHMADWFLDITADGSLETFFPAATREYACTVEELWHDPAIQATYERKDELHILPDVAGSFLQRVVELSSNEYEPSDYDILCAEGLIQGSGLAEIEFPLIDREPVSGAFNDTVEFPSSSNRYQVIRVGGIGLNEGRKWLDMFEDVRAVIFCVAISEYDQMWTDPNGRLCNRMILTKELFENIVKYPCFKNTPFVLLMNKYDLFEEKILKGIPLTTCEWFSDYSPVGASNSTQAQQAYTYLVHKFKKLLDDRKLYTFSMNARDRSSVAGAFQYIKEILKWEENKASGWGILPEDLSYSDMSSFSTHSHMRQGH